MHVNPYQGSYHKALFVCSAGVLRSPTAAHWAAEHKGWNTRSCGIYQQSVPQISQVLIDWADRIYCMQDRHRDHIERIYGDEPCDKTVVLDIPDNFSYRQPELVELVSIRLEPYPCTFMSLNSQI